MLEHEFLLELDSHMRTIILLVIVAGPAWTYMSGPIWSISKSNAQDVAQARLLRRADASKSKVDPNPARNKSPSPDRGPGRPKNDGLATTGLSQKLSSQSASVASSRSGTSNSHRQPSTSQGKTQSTGSSNQKTGGSGQISTPRSKIRGSTSISRTPGDQSSKSADAHGESKTSEARPKRPELTAAQKASRSRYDQSYRANKLAAMSPEEWREHRDRDNEYRRARRAAARAQGLPPRKKSREQLDRQNARVRELRAAKKAGIQLPPLTKRPRYGSENQPKTEVHQGIEALPSWSITKKRTPGKRQRAMQSPLAATKGQSSNLPSTRAMGSTIASAAGSAGWQRQNTNESDDSIGLTSLVGTSTTSGSKRHRSKQNEPSTGEGGSQSQHQLGDIPLPGPPGTSESAIWKMHAKWANSYSAGISSPSAPPQFEEDVSSPTR